MLSRRALLASGVTLGSAALGGCLGATPQGNTGSTTAGDRSTVPSDGAETGTTPLPDTLGDFPAGPQSRPDLPDALTVDTVRSFVRTHNYRYAYNELWMGAETDVSLTCEVHRVRERSFGYEVVVSCTGYAETGGGGGASNGTETETVVHADYFTQYHTYFLDEDSVVRRDATEAEVDSVG